MKMKKILILVAIISMTSCKKQICECVLTESLNGVVVRESRSTDSRYTNTTKPSCSDNGYTESYSYGSYRYLDENVCKMVDVE